MRIGFPSLRLRIKREGRWKGADASLPRGRKQTSALLLARKEPGPRRRCNTNTDQGSECTAEVVGIKDVQAADVQGQAWSETGPPGENECMRET